MMPVRLVSFDLDGTLIDTAQEIALAANAALREHGLPEQPLPAMTARVGHGSAALMRGLHTDLAGDAQGVDAQALIASFDAQYARLIGRCSQAYPGAAQALEALKQAGIARICTTNKNLGFSRALLASHGLLEHFDLVVGGDSLAWRKPDARVLQHVVDCFAVSPAEAAHLGDSATDIRAARATGLAAWAVPYGYDGGEPIEGAHPDQIFPSLAAAAHHAIRSHDRSASPMAFADDRQADTTRRDA